MTTQLGEPEKSAVFSRIIAGVWRMASWNWSVEERVRYIEEALDTGVTTFDHADIYGDYTVEALFGEALARVKGLRQRLQLVTKCNIKLVSTLRPEHRLKHYDSSRAHIIASAENSLRLLKSDHIDLLLLHRPDMLMHADEVAEAFSALRKEGKVRWFGASNFTASGFELLHSRFALTTHQIQLSPLYRAPLSDGTLDQCQRLSMPAMIWSPLAGGDLFTASDETTLRIRGVLDQLARQYAVSPVTVAYAWVLRHPARMLPIVGSRRSAVLAEAVGALSVELDRQDWYAVLEAATGHAVA